ncbi:hypothetical protein, partial [Enterobacter asburiae]
MNNLNDRERIPGNISPGTLIATTPDREKSAIAADSTTYASGDVTLKDASGNAVSGDQAALTADAVAVPHAA